MPRALSVSHVTVPAEHEAEYLATIQKLAALAERRGQRLWVFRSVDKPHTFIEFSESPSALAHRARASRIPEELRLEMRLQAIAKYEPGSWDLWEEITTESSRPPGGWTPEQETEDQDDAP